MPTKKKTVTSAGEFVRAFSHYSDVALAEPVIITKNGRPRNILISAAEYDRLKKRDQQAFSAADTPDEFLAAIEKIAHGKR
jgi:prevent-host-death family protein